MRCKWLCWPMKMQIVIIGTIYHLSTINALVVKYMNISWQVKILFIESIPIVSFILCLNGVMHIEDALVSQLGDMIV